MDNKNPRSSILLTYKGKVLLMRKNNGYTDKEDYPWCFIEGVKEERESYEHALIRKVEREIGIKIENVEFVSKSCYHARLTDDNVNKIERKENKLLDFFSPKELNNLFLSEPVQEFIYKHGSLIQ